MKIKTLRNTTAPFTNNVLLLNNPSISSMVYFHGMKYTIICLQCFDAVGWAAGWASGL